MSRFRFLHAADLHLDSPFDGLSRTDPALAARLRDASLETLDRLVETAEREQVAFVVLAGDIYDGLDRGVRAQVRLDAACARLATAGIAVFAIWGNHDPVDRSTRPAALPRGLTLFGAEAVETVAVRRDDRTIATVSGISYAHRGTSENLALRFSRPSGSPFAVALLHATLGGASEDHAPYAPCRIDDLERAGFDYWALGHIHRRELIARGQRYIAYAGNTQGRSFKPSEQGEKGALVVDVEGDRIVSPPRFVPLDSVRFLTLELPIDKVGDLVALTHLAIERSREALAAHPQVTLLARAHLHGRGELHSTLLRPGVIAEWFDALQSQQHRHDPRLVWLDHRSATVNPIDLAQLAHRDDFTAAVVRQAERWRQDTTLCAAQFEAIEREMPELVRKVVRRYGAPDEADLAQAVSRARDIALALLLGDAESTR